MNWKVQLFKLFLILQIIKIDYESLGRNITASLRSSLDASTHSSFSGDLSNVISNQPYHAFIDGVANNRINSLSKLSNNMSSITHLLIIIYISIYVVKPRGIWQSLLLFVLSSLNWCQSLPTTAPTPSCLTIYVNVTNSYNEFDVNDFNGLYTLSNLKQYDRPIWTVPQSPNDQNIRYYFGTNWIINGIGGGNILSYASTDYLPPINDITAQWTHASLGGSFYVDMHCISSYSPTTAPTESPSPSPTHLPTNAPSTSPTDFPTSGPTQPPTFQPTPACPTVFVRVLDANGLFNDTHFDGLYTYIGNRWEVPQIPNLKNIQYFGGYWIIKGFDHQLSHQSSASAPPYKPSNAEWAHSSVSGIFHVNITCISSFAPIAAPTSSPSLAPTQSPTDIPTNTPTVSPSPSPTNIPTDIPTNAPTTKPTITPTKTPSAAPSNIPSRSPSNAPSTSPSHAPTSIPSETPTSAPTAIPSSTPSEAPSVSPTLTPSLNPSISPTAIPTLSPSAIPSLSPSKTPSKAPTNAPSLTPTSPPTNIPSLNPSTSPTLTPSISPTKIPSGTPTVPPSLAPTHSPTIAPSGSPTQPPTNAPIPQCPTITVNIFNATHLFDVDDFNGLYTNIEIVTNGYRTWTVPQSPTDKRIRHIGNTWVIEGYGVDRLSTDSNENFPPENATWTHSANTNWNIQVDVVCGISFAPITAPTAAPSAPPTNAPSYSPSTAPTRSPSVAPSTAPSNNPSVAPSTAPSNSPSLAPSNVPSNNPSIAPSIAPTAAPSEAPSIAPTVPPTNNPSIAPSKVPSSAPSMSPSLFPSQFPSISPTLTPSLSPSSTPTQPPSTAPSNAPSFAPSMVPSLAPSNNPTAAPSREPSMIPTLVPSFSPTVAPTLSPTIAPTLAPSFSPTNTPSTSPTACIDYQIVNNTKFDSMDGMDRVYTANITQQIKDLNDEINQAASKVDSYETYFDQAQNIRLDFEKESIECDNRRREICFIGCYFPSFCEETQVQPNNENMKQLAVTCTARQACLSMNIGLIDTNIADFTLICDNKLSCESVNITVPSDNKMNMTIICGDELSCSEMSINLNTNNDYNNMWYLEVTCTEATACKDMYINTNHNYNIDITMKMYRHSEGIKIVHPKYENLHFICSAPNETHFIRYNTNKELSDSEIFLLSQEEYGGELPCEGITVDCTENDKETAKQCFMDYNLTESIDHFNIRKDAIHEGISCYWFNVDQLYNIRCVGECDVNADAVNNSDGKISNAILASIIIFCLILSAMIIVMLVRVWKSRKYNEEQKLAMPMQNPMVIVIGIGHYDEQQERSTEFDNLNVQIDIRKLLRLFNDKKLNYVVFPEYDKHKIRVRWTYKELSRFLKKQSKILERNLEQKQAEEEYKENEEEDQDDDNNKSVYFDGLIVIISCHGVKGCIITSDYREFNKKNLQLIFTAEHGLSRNIPRIFLYDCCDGSNFKTKGIKKKTKTQTGTATSINSTIDQQAKYKTINQGKDVGLRENRKLKRNDTKKALKNDEWHNENNKLGVIHAANPGFQANMNNDIGSYVIAFFEEKISKGLTKRKDYFLYQIFNEMQTELTKAKKQLPIFNQNDPNIRYVQFKKNTSNTSNNHKPYMFSSGSDEEDMFSSGSEGHEYMTEDEGEGYNDYFQGDTHVQYDDLKEEEDEEEEVELQMTEIRNNSKM